MTYTVCGIWQRTLGMPLPNSTSATSSLSLRTLLLLGWREILYRIARITHYDHVTSLCQPPGTLQTPSSRWLAQQLLVERCFLQVPHL